MKLQGVGAELLIVVTAVYLQVTWNCKDNYDDMLTCLRAIMDIRNRCAVSRTPVVACWDWNATATRGQQFGYTGHGWKEGDQLLRRFIDK
eukprot:2848211-Rhodomonas_salina.6